MRKMETQLLDWENYMTLIKFVYFLRMKDIRDTYDTKHLCC